MSRPPRQAPRAPLASPFPQATQAAAEMRPLYVEDIPEVQAAVRQAISEGVGDPQMLQGHFDASALAPDGTLDLGAIRHESNAHLETPPAPMVSQEYLSETPALQNARAAEIRRNQELRAAALGTTVENLFSDQVMRDMYSRESIHTIIVTSLPQDHIGEKTLSGSMNGLGWTVQKNTPIQMPYSMVRFFVEHGRATPPPECPELLAVSMRASARVQGDEMMLGAASMDFGALPGMEGGFNLATQGNSIVRPRGMAPARQPIIAGRGFSFG